MNLAHLLQRMARQFPNRLAIFHGTQVVATYTQWAQRCAHLAQQFQDAGLRPGERIAQNENFPLADALFTLTYQLFQLLPFGSLLTTLGSLLLCVCG